MPQAWAWREGGKEREREKEKERGEGTERDIRTNTLLSLSEWKNSEGRRLNTLHNMTSEFSECAARDSSVPDHLEDTQIGCGKSSQSSC